MAALLRAAGLGAGFALAARQGPPPATPARADVRVRPATRRDDDIVVALHLEEVGFHAALTPLVRELPGVAAALRARRADALVWVAEVGGEVVGLAECAETTRPDDGVVRMLPPGRSGYLNSVGVRADRRGRGIGTALADTVLRAFAARGCAYQSLYFCWDNPLASRFWPRRGLAPVWTSWEALLPDRWPPPR